MATEPRAVLLLAYGGPDSLEDVAAFLGELRGGRPPPQALVDDVRSRYALIGGRSPLLARTREQAAALASALDGWGVTVGMRHWKPFIADALQSLAADGVRRVVGLPMAPHYSAMSVGAYRRSCEGAPAVRRGEIQLAFVPGFSGHPGFLAAVGERAAAALGRLPAEDAGRTLLVFTAHSLPERIVAEGDPYPDLVAASANAVAERLCLEAWRVAYQSAGGSGEPWLGPDVGAVLAQAAAEGYRTVLLVPIGFVSDHVEILHDVDVLCRRRAEELGLGFARSESLNTSPLFIAALADLVRGAARETGWS